MSKYTTTIKSLIDNDFDFQMTSYPIFDEDYRETLNDKILNHYYLNEIGFETAALFRFYLNNKLNEIMPKYNILYNAQISVLENIAGNVDLTETLTRTTSNTTTATSSSSNEATNKGKSVYLDTPQGDTYKGDIDSTNYATNVTWSDNDNTSSITDESNGSGTGSEDYVKRIVGNNGNKYNIDVLNEIRKNLIDIDLAVINDLEELFMQIF